MSIKTKIILIVLPLIVASLLLTGIASSLSARNGITRVATSFLRFKAEELEKYAESQWRLLVENQLDSNPEFLAVTKDAIGSFAESLIRSETELILAVDRAGGIELATGSIDLSGEELEGLKRLAAERVEGWQRLRLGEVERVAQTLFFEPFEWYILVTEHRVTFYKAVNQIYWQSGIILSAVSAVAVILLMVFAHFLSSPLRRVVTVMRNIIRAGDLSKRVDVLYRDETGELGHTFNLMSGELEKAYNQIKSYALQAVIAQKKEQKIRNIFQKYVPKEVIDRFFENPESMLIGEDRILAILFSDVRRFTSIAENMLPVDMVESLNHYFGIMVDIVTGYGGIVDKYIGDAVMAFYGAPVRHGDDAYRAVQSGFKMLESLKDFNRWQARKQRPEFRIGIGINYGYVTVGNIGSEKKMDYTIIGDMVNLASRIENLTKKYQVPMLISDSVARKVENQVHCRLIDRVAVKGKYQGTAIYLPRPKLNDREEKGWQLHKSALEHYYNRGFKEAGDLFTEVSRLLPNDYISRMYLERCRHYLKSPPPADWNGVVALAEK